MTDINHVVVTGRLTRDIELSTVGTGKSVAKGSLAINRKNKDNESTVFLDFTAWEKAGEILSEYTKKGSRIILEGRLEQDTWERDGKKVSKIYLVVSNFSFLDKKD